MASKLLTYDVCDNIIKVKQLVSLTAGSIGEQIKIALSDEWIHRSNTAVFSSVNKMRPTNRRICDLVLPPAVGGIVTVEIPPYALELHGQLTVGIYGMEDGRHTSTIWATPVEVLPGAVPEGISTPPPQTIVEQIMRTAQEAEQIALKLQEDANAGLFDGEPGPPGDTPTTIDGGRVSDVVADLAQ